MGIGTTSSRAKRNTIGLSAPNSRGYLMSGVVFLFISAMFITLAYVMAYYEDVYKGVAESKKMDTLYNAVTDASRVLALGDNNVLQDALSDAAAEALVQANWDNATNRSNYFCNITGLYNESIGGVVNKSDPVEHPNYASIRAFWGMSEPNQYGGITGCGGNHLLNNATAGDNLAGPSNCEAYPYEAGNATREINSTRIAQIAKACDILTRNESRFLRDTVYNYSLSAMQALVIEYGAELSSLAINATFVPDRACDAASISASNGTLKIVANFSIEYSLRYAGVEKTARLLTSRQMLVGGKEKGLVVATRVFNVSANVSSKNYTYNATANCTLTCYENRTGYKNTTESLEWANVQVINVPRMGLPPTIYWRFDKNFHLKTYYTEKAGVCSVCERIFLDPAVDCGNVCSAYAADIANCTNITVVSPSLVSRDITINNKTCFKESCGEYAYGW